MDDDRDNRYRNLEQTIATMTATTTIKLATRTSHLRAIEHFGKLPENLTDEEADAWKSWQNNYFLDHICPVIKNQELILSLALVKTTLQKFGRNDAACHTVYQAYLSNPSIEEGKREYWLNELKTYRHCLLEEFRLCELVASKAPTLNEVIKGFQKHPHAAMTAVEIMIDSITTTKKSIQHHDELLTYLDSLGSSYLETRRHLADYLMSTLTPHPTEKSGGSRNET